MSLKKLFGSAPLLLVAIALMAGIAIASVIQVPFVPYLNVAWPMALWSLLAVLVVMGLLVRRLALVQSGVVLLAVGVVGMILWFHKQAELHGFAYDDQLRQIEAVVISEPAEKPKSMAVDVLLTESGRKMKCYVAKNERSRQLKPGDGLLLTTRIQPVSDFRAGHFDYRRYLEQQGFSGQCYVGDNDWQLKQVSLTHISMTDRARIRFLGWRHHLLMRYRLLGGDEGEMMQLADERYAVLAAMTLGDKSALSKELRDTYSITGASHVLALSGLHLGIIYFLLSWLTIGRKRRWFWSQVVLVLGLWAFAFLVGLPVSVVRSATMFSAFALFSLGGRRPMSLGVLSFAAIVILFQNPYALFDVGFRLSFMAVLGILLFMPLFSCIVTPRWVQSHWLGGRLWSLTSVSVAAQLGVVPLIAFYFGRFSTYFLLTNLVVLPVAYFILCGAVLMLLVPFEPLATIELGVVDGLNHVLGYLSQLPLASIEGLNPSALQVVLCYVIIGACYAIGAKLLHDTQ